MDYSNYEIYDFDHVSSFNMSTGYAERSYKAHWHSYGEILLVGPDMPNIYCVGRNTYELDPDDIVLVWPMEMHSITDADREVSSLSAIFSFSSESFFLDIAFLRISALP